MLLTSRSSAFTPLPFEGLLHGWFLFAVYRRHFHPQTWSLRRWEDTQTENLPSELRSLLLCWVCYGVANHWFVFNISFYAYT